MKECRLIIGSSLAKKSWKNLNPGPLINQNDFGINKIAMPCFLANVQPVDKAVSSNSQMDILKY